MENRAHIEKIQDLQVKSKVEDITLPGDKDKTPMLMTTVQFKYEGGPGKMSELLYAMAANAEIEVEMSSPQMVLDILKEKHKGEEER